MKKKGLEQKIILALFLGIALYTPAVYAADVTLGNVTKNEKNTNVVNACNVTANNQTIDTANGSITMVVDNSKWSNVTDASAKAHGFYNVGHTGILLQGGTEYFPINATATGGNATSTSAYAFAFAVAVGIYDQDNSITTINGNTTINATATGGSATSASVYANANAYGIIGQNSITTINGNTTINATATGGSAAATSASAYANASAAAYGVYGSNAKMTISGNVIIDTTATGGSGTNANAWAFALYGQDGSLININQTTGNSYTVQLTGDIAAYNGSTINLTLSNSNSFLRGNVLTDTSSGNAIDFTVANGAVWQPVYDNRNGTLNATTDNFNNSKTGTYSATENSIKQINLSNGGSIDLAWDNTTRNTYRALLIETLDGNNGILKVNTNLAAGTGDGVLVITNHAPNLGVAITYDPAMENMTGIGYHAVGAGTYSPLIHGGSTLFGVTSEYKEYSYVPVMSGTNTITGLNLGISTNTKAAASAAGGQSQVAQIIDNHLRKRLGDLRESPDTENGTWARVYKGKLTNEKYSKIETDYTGIQAGYDTEKKVKDGKSYQGVAFSYTNADNAFYRGTGKNKAYDMALYKTWLGNSGHYYDIIAKRGKIDSSYQVTDISNNHSTASYKTWTNSLSAEYGYKKQLSKGWYLEPQAELTYGAIGGVDYTTSSGMQVKQDNINRLIGRMGMGIGRKLNNGSHIYSSLSMLHEFQGDGKIQAGTLNTQQDMSGTWYEFILGTTAKLSDHSTGYINAEKLFGKDQNSNWQLNAGCRFSF